MKKSGRRKAAIIFAVVLTVIVLIMEFVLRFAETFSPAVYRSIQGQFTSYPLFFGSLWILVMVAGVSIAYVKYSEKKTTGKLVALIFWLAIFLTILTYGLYQMYWH